MSQVISIIALTAVTGMQPAISARTLVAMWVCAPLTALGFLAVISFLYWTVKGATALVGVVVMIVVTLVSRSSVVNVADIDGLQTATFIGATVAVGAVWALVHLVDGVSRGRLSGIGR